MSWRSPAKDVAGSSLSVVALAALVVLATGVWPPFVAIESGSMQPTLDRGDMVVVVEEHRFADGAAVDGTGVVPTSRAYAAGHYAIQGPGDVILLYPNGDRNETPVIHRAMFYVEEGENWYDEADPRYVGDAESCEQLRFCPAPNAGFITLGDDNERYDQATWKYRPVEPRWVVGRALVRVPYLGWFRLTFDAVV